jgi:hypothetical protein
VIDRMFRTTVAALALLCVAAPLAGAQDAAAAAARAEARAARRDEARRERMSAAQPGIADQGGPNQAMVDRTRIEGALREALAQAVRQRLNLNDDQTTKLIDVNRRFSEDRLRLARDEIRVRRELRQSVNAGAAANSQGTARLLDQLLETQQQRVNLQQKEQTELSVFLTPEQRARYIAMMEQLRRRIQLRADSARASALPPD